MSVQPDPREPRAYTTSDASHAHVDRESRSFSDLVSDLVNQMTSLFRTEVTLFKAEMKENLTKMGIGAGEIGAGAMIIQASLVILLIALVQGIDNVFGIGHGWSSLIVGVIFVIIGALLVKKGTDNISTSPVPDRTTRQVSKDVNLAKEEVR